MSTIGLNPISAVGRDLQRERVYRWERKAIAPHDRSKVPFDNIQSIVNHVWPAEHPPVVRALPKQATRTAGTGHRYRLRFHRDHLTPTWVIIHEVAHALTNGDGHGPQFVGVYIYLINKFIGVPLAALHYTARQAGVQFDTAPTFNLSGEYQ